MQINMFSIVVYGTVVLTCYYYLYLYPVAFNFFI